MPPQFRVLLVDDDYMTRKSLAAALQRGDLDVDVAESAWEAKHLIDRFADQYCCILLDLVLPDGDATQIAAHVREAAPQIPVLALTGTVPSADVPAAVDYADVVRLVMRKPVDISTVSDLIIALGKAKISDSPIAAVNDV
jgi:DNA-binding response OmpR family regulator